jgi:curved DNA-binding protein CbpA
MNSVLQHFGTLNLPLSSTRAQVKARFYRLALACHPDKVPLAQKAQATEDMKILNEAHEVLMAYFGGLEREEKEREERVAREREREKKRERERDAAEEQRKKEWLEGEFAKLRREREEAERKEAERAVDGMEEVRRMSAAWQQTYAEAERDGRVIERVERRAPAGANIVVGEEEEADEDVEMEVSDGDEEQPAKIKFSLPNLKK